MLLSELPVLHGARHLAASLAALAFCLPCLAVAQPGAAVSLPAAATPTGVAPTADELRALEQSLGADAAAAPASAAAVPAIAQAGTGFFNPAMAVIFDAALSYFSDPEPLQLGGHDPKRTGFDLQQLEINLRSTVDPFFRFDTSLVFGAEGIELEEAWAETTSLPAGLQLRAGKMLLPVGRTNPTHPHAWKFADQPIVLGKFLGEDGGRGLGLEAAWLAPLPWFTQLVAMVSQSEGECCSRSFLADAERPVRDPTDLLLTARLEQFVPFGADWGVLLGLGGMTGPNATGVRNRTEIYGGDLHVRFRPLGDPDRLAVSLQVEWHGRRRDLGDRTLHDQGGYGFLFWDIDPSWSIGARTEYATGRTDDPLDPDWTDARLRHAVVATWRPSHFSRLRLQVMDDQPRWRDDDILGIMLTFEALTGEHPVHPY